VTYGSSIVVKHLKRQVSTPIGIGSFFAEVKTE